MAVKAGINGFGRIGRLILRAGINNPDIEFVAVNDITDTKTLAHLFKYDSTFGTYPGKVEHDECSIKIDGRKIAGFCEKNPEAIDWGKMGVDIVFESTGKFTKSEDARTHIKAGAKKVIITAPAKGEGAVTVCMGINENSYDPKKHDIVSNASCTTNCLAPIVKVLHENFVIKSGLMTTIHAYTNDQKILDAPHKDLRRARSAGMSMIPTTTGAAKAIALVMPELEGKLTGIAIRVPTPNVSLVDLNAIIEKPATKEEINSVMKKAAESELGIYLRYTDEPLVSRDLNGDPHSSIFDSCMTDVIGENLIKVLAWYDNEWGYSNRLIDLALHMAKKGF
jgi:glyceraldehyde 3-phosphate dehydrogenase